MLKHLKFAPACFGFLLESKPVSTNRLAFHANSSTFHDSLDQIGTHTDTHTHTHRHTHRHTHTYTHTHTHTQTHTHTHTHTHGMN
jgi:hypothetical protein